MFVRIVITTMTRKFAQAAMDKHTRSLDKASTSLPVSITPIASILPNSVEHCLFYYSLPACPPPLHSETALAGTPVRMMPKETEQPSAISSPVALCIGHANLASSLSRPRGCVPPLHIIHYRATRDAHERRTARGKLELERSGVHKGG